MGTMWQFERTRSRCTHFFFLFRRNRLAFTISPISLDFDSGKIALDSEKVKVKIHHPVFKELAAFVVAPLLRLVIPLNGDRLILTCQLDQLKKPSK